MVKVLAVDDDSLVLLALESSLAKAGLEVETTTSGKTAKDILSASPNDFKVALVDFHMPDLTGDKVARALKRINPNLLVVMVSSEESPEIISAAYDSGVDHYLKKGGDGDEILRQVLSCIDQQDLSHQANIKSPNPLNPADKISSVLGLVGQSTGLYRVAELVSKYSLAEDAVLIRGENGVGKEQVARSVHLNSARKKGPFVPVNCTAIPVNLLESELFGHKRGSFTGATMDKKGLFAEADGGTLFLDEIGDMPLEVQAKLLRAIQEKTIRPVGSNQPTSVDIRFVSATHRNLEEAVTKSQFRQDLYYRIKVLPISIPPLRDRPEDIEPLALHFLERKNNRSGLSKTISKATLEKLKSHSWPGNVRELESKVAEMYAKSDLKLEMRLTSDSTDSELNEQITNLEENLPSQNWLWLRDKMDKIEQEFIRREFVRANGKVASMARSMNMRYSTLRDKIKKLEEEGLFNDL